MDWLLTREVVISLAVLGAIFSTAASILQVRGYVSARTAQALNYAGYGAMGVSMLLFIIVGYRGPG